MLSLDEIDPSGSGEEAVNVKILRTYGRRTKGDQKRSLEVTAQMSYKSPHFNVP